MLVALTDDLRWQILQAQPEESDGRLARRLNLAQPAVAQFRRRVRAEGGWVCKLVTFTCRSCGQEWLKSNRAVATNRCRACRLAASAPKPRRVPLDPEVRRTRTIALARARYRMLSAASVGHDSKRQQPWTKEDDRYLLEHELELRSPEGVARLTKHLGRSYAACSCRLAILKRRERQ